MLFVFVKKMANLSPNKDLVHPLICTGRTVHWCVSRAALQFTQVLRTIRTRKRVHNPKFSWEPVRSLPAHMKEDNPVQTYVTANKGSYENTSFSLNRSHADFVSWPLSSAFLFHSPNRRKMTKERRFLWLEGRQCPWGRGAVLKKWQGLASRGATLHGHSNPKSTQVGLTDPGPREEQGEKVLSPSVLTTSLV